MKESLRSFRAEVHQVERSDRRVIAEEAVRGQVLSHDGGGDGPVVAQVELQCRAAAASLDRVVMAADVGGIADRAGAHLAHRRAWRNESGGGIGAAGVGRLARPGREGHRAVLDAGVGIGAGDVVDVAAVVLVPADQANGGNRRQRNVDEALGLPAVSAVLNVVGIDVVARLEFGRIRLVGDDPDRARLGARAVQRALRPLQDLDALYVVDMHVDRAVDGGHRLLVEISADARLRARMIAVAAAHHAAHVDVRASGLAVAALPLAADVGHARAVLHIVVEIDDVELFQLLGVEDLDADGHVLQVLHLLLRGDHDLLEAARLRAALRLACRMDHGSACKNRGDGRGERQAPQQWAVMADRAAWHVRGLAPQGCRTATNHDFTSLPFNDGLWIPTSAGACSAAEVPVPGTSG